MCVYPLYEQILKHEGTSLNMVVMLPTKRIVYASRRKQRTLSCTTVYKKTLYCL